jgi:carboxymethylenebutenolidase
MTCEVVNMKGANGDTINAYVARPTGTGPFPGVVFIHHILGWDEWSSETTRRLAQHGFAAILPNLFFRDGHGSPEEVAATVRGAGGPPDQRVVDDVSGAIDYLRSQPYWNGKVGLMGPCSGGRHAFLAAASLGNKVDAVVELWGGNVVQAENTPQRPVSPHTLTAGLTAPLLGLFGNDDQGPLPEQVNVHEEELREAGHKHGPRVSVSRSIFPLVDERDHLYFGDASERGDQIGLIDANTRAIFGHTYAAEPDVLIEQLRQDEAIAAADTLLLTVPNQLGVEYNAHVIEAILTQVAPGLGWR